MLRDLASQRHCLIVYGEIGKDILCIPLCTKRHIIALCFSSALPNQVRSLRSLTSILRYADIPLPIIVADDFLTSSTITVIYNNFTMSPLFPLASRSAFDSPRILSVAGIPPYECAASTTPLPRSTSVCTRTWMASASSVMVPGGLGYLLATDGKSMAIA